MHQEKISILGCGWYGLAMAEELVRKGYRVKGSTTSEAKLELLRNNKVEAYLINLDDDKIPTDFFDTDVLIISISPKEFYLRRLQNVIKWVEEAQVKQVILISSTGVFDDGNQVLNELSTPKPTEEKGKILLAAEKLFQENTSFQTTVIRFGGLIGPGRNLAKYFAGKQQIPNGLAPVNLIDLNDCIGISLAILKQKAFGNIYHGVSPEHPTRETFYSSLCEQSGMEKPHFIHELLQWKQVESVNVSKLNYRFGKLASSI